MARTLICGSRPRLEPLEDRTLLSVTLIDFDHDANGNVIQAPSVFIATTHLSELYAPLGVHFSGGVGPNDGGAILDQDGNFGVPAHSGRNFLAFNVNAVMSDGGVPRDPETIQFDTPMVAVSIYAAGGYVPATFEMDAYDVNGNLVDSNVVNTQDYSQLSVASDAGIDHVVLTASGSSTGFWVYDDLSFDDGMTTAVALVTAHGLSGGPAPQPVQGPSNSASAPAALNPVVADSYFSSGSPNQAANTSASHVPLGQGGLRPEVLLPSMADLNSNLATGL